MTLRELNRLSEKPYLSVKDPISALTHFIGFVASVILTPFLFIKAFFHSPDLKDLVGISIYMLSMSALYGASAAYHTFLLPKKADDVLKKLDHMSIFLLIAGTYTPLCLSIMEPSLGMPLLIAVWSVALGGMLLKAIWVHCPRIVSSIIYIAMGWLAVFRVRTVYRALGLGAFLWLLAGGILYTIGGVLYSLHFSLNEDWSEHEIFHLFVLFGSLCHFILIFFYAV